MAKRTAAKRQPKKEKAGPATKARTGRDGWEISNPSTSLLLVPEDQLHDEAGLWSGPDAPEDELWFSDALDLLLEDVGLDAKKRKFLWPDAGPLDFDESVQLIRNRGLDFPEDKIGEFLMFWIEALYEPEGYSDSQMAELDRLTERWVRDIEKGKN